MNTQRMVGKVRKGMNNSPPQGLEKFVLCGHINLHKSDTCNAQFVNYLNKATKWLDFDGDKFTNDVGHLHKRGNRPVTVSQWDQQRATRTAGVSDSDSEVGSDTAGQPSPGRANIAGSPRGVDLI